MLITDFPDLFSPPLFYYIAAKLLLHVCIHLLISLIHL